MRRSVKIASVIVSAALLLFSGCSSGSDYTPVKAAVNPLETYDYDKMELVQLEAPSEGQPIAEIDTTYGTIKAMIFTDRAPKTAANFIARAKEGFYDGKDIYGIYEGATFFSGAFDENRNSGVTSDGQPIENEYSVDLWPFKGAFLAFNGNSGYGDSRFMVINERALSEQNVTDLRNMTKTDGTRMLPDKLIDAFVERGAVIDFCAAFTVFAQAYEGVDVIGKICAVPVGEDNATPVEKIYINKITISEYHTE